MGQRCAEQIQSRFAGPSATLRGEPNERREPAFGAGDADLKAEQISGPIHQPPDGGK
jgi:hypothetical protein